MAVLVNKKTKIMVQGITGTQASFHIQRAINYGTRIVAGVVPNKTEDMHLGVPVFSTVREAKEKPEQKLLLSLCRQSLQNLLFWRQSERI